MNIKKIIKCGVKYLTQPEYRFNVNSALGMYTSMPDEKYLIRKYKLTMGKELDLSNPKTFNEKLQWLKLYNRRPEYTMMADKVAVRDYIAKTIGEEYLIPCLGVWDNPDDIDFDALPDQFVLKCNHNSGLGMCICKDKSKLDIKKVKDELRKGLKQNYYLSGREWPYKNVKPRIIAEKYITFDGESPEDYKFFCFDGEVKCFKVDYDRFKGHRANYYTTDGELMRFGEVVCSPDFERDVRLPKMRKKMISLAERLSAGHPFLRVDFYEVDDKIYFGELTFYPASGFGPFCPEEWDTTLGEWIKLPTKKN